ncbi:MAG: hypothetical protein PHT77_11890 [Bacteroidales bacterium]|nr:hypothetical protein [Bacteroidales bacterium]
MKYRKKPVIVEAELYKPGLEDGIDKLTNKPYIKTLEGNHIITQGDWVIIGVKGERYPCKPDVFEMTYEIAD